MDSVKTEVAVAEKKITADRLESLGFKRLSGEVKELSVRKRKLAIAYEHYRFVRQEKIDAFNKKLKEKTKKKQPWGGESWQALSFDAIETYDKVPPADVLEALEVAQGRKCFDSFEIASIKEVKDPILFGRIARCSDRFYIAQWDSDISIEDLLLPNEG